MGPRPRITRNEAEQSGTVEMARTSKMLSKTSKITAGRGQRGTCSKVGALGFESRVSVKPVAANATNVGETAGEFNRDFGSLADRSGGIAETITWHNASTPPDADTTFLLQSPAADEPVWPGYWDGERWLWADGTEATGVVAYAELPRGGRA